MDINNSDIVGLYNRVNRFTEELFKSVSSGTSQFNAFDQSRLATYLTAIDTYHAWVIAQPQLDLPESHPSPITLEEFPTIEDVENENVNDLLRMFKTTNVELINSQSARDASGINKFDSGRLTALIAKARAFLNDYVAAVTPLDLPESSPQAGQSGPGRLGV